VQSNNSPEPKPATKLYCFLNAERVCGPACMSYLGPTERPEGVDYADKAWASCSMLVNAHRVGKHVVVLAQTVSQLVSLTKDNLRTAQAAPGNPR
jgi:hypothetical protein